MPTRAAFVRHPLIERAGGVDKSMERAWAILEDGYEEKRWEVDGSRDDKAQDEPKGPQPASLPVLVSASLLSSNPSPPPPCPPPASSPCRWSVR